MATTMCMAIQWMTIRAYRQQMHNSGYTIVPEDNRVFRHS